MFPWTAYQDCSGHQSVRVTEKHYAPSVRSRQDQFEADVRQVWKIIAAASSRSSSTPQVSERRVAAKRLKIKPQEWWRRGELNPRPRSLATRRLHAYPVPKVSPTELRAGKTRRRLVRCSRRRITDRNATASLLCDASSQARRRRLRRRATYFWLGSESQL